MTQHIALLKVAMRAGEDPGIKVRGASLFNCGRVYMYEATLRLQWFHGEFLVGAQPPEAPES
jgi:hypothetical protein